VFKTIKKFKIILSILIIFFFILFLLSRGLIYKRENISYGITFSKKQSIGLGLNWKENYLAIFDDLGVKKIRLSAYFNEVEKENNIYTWEDLDWQIEEASKRGAEIILALGMRLPRWPECHPPLWFKNLSEDEKNRETLEYIEKVIKRYKGEEAIKVWQIENEPFLPHFGECPDLDKDFLDLEIALTRKLDSRPILISDSGELSLWVPAAKRADIFGTTMYRDTYSNVLKTYIHYPIEPGFFRFKRNISRLFVHPEKWLVIELQGEPWGPEPFQNLSREERDKTMSYEKFLEIIEFSRKTGFQEFYLWGAEWWYWEKEVNKEERFWREAKGLF
jgi:hypothetical protein